MSESCSRLLLELARTSVHVAAPRPTAASTTTAAMSQRRLAIDVRRALATGRDGLERRDRVVRPTDRQRIEGALDATETGLKRTDECRLLRHVCLEVGERG